MDHQTLLAFTDEDPTPQPVVKPEPVPVEPDNAVHLDAVNGVCIAKFPRNDAISTKLKMYHAASWDFTEHKAWTIEPNHLYGILDSLEAFSDVQVIKTDAFEKLYVNSMMPAVYSPEFLDKKHELEGATFSHPRFKRTLFPYQAEGVEFLRRAGGSALIADEPGLGKTTVALAFLTEVGGKTLIVTPAAAKFVWATMEGSDATGEIEKCIDGANWHIISGRKPKPIPETDFVIINYDILSWHVDALKEWGFDNIVLDEAHRIKNPEAKRSIAAASLGTSAKNRLCLTATPMPNRTRELWPIFQFIAPDRYKHWNHFGFQYCIPQIRNVPNRRYNTRGGPPVMMSVMTWDGNDNLIELRQRLRDIMIRRKKQDVTDLPDKLIQTHYWEMTKAMETEYKAMQGDYVTWLREQDRLQDAVDEEERGGESGHMQRLRQFVLDAKMSGVKEMVDEIINDEGTSIMDGDEHTIPKVVIFSNFLKPIAELKEYFGDKAVSITGASSEAQRNEAPHKLQTDPNTRVFIGQLQACSEAITLTAAQHVIFLDMSWTPKDHLQGEDRVHRIGTTGTVNVHYILMAKTVDTIIHKMVERKLEATQAVMEGRMNSEETIDVRLETMKELRDSA